jgi:hypothetical protein
MTDAEGLRKKALQCRKLASDTGKGPEAVEQLLQWADDYEQESHAIEEAADYGSANR